MRFSRNEMIFGDNGSKKLSNSKVAIFGIGGVGGFACEAIIRAGVSNIVIIDYDTVDISNINRQIIALDSTVGEYKVDTMEKRISDINPSARVAKFNMLIDENTIDDSELNLELKSCDYIVDAIDMIKSKIMIIKRAREYNIPIISAMGAGNKLEPTMLEVCDIKKTSVCPLARHMRRELKKIGITELKVVYSKEQPKKIYIEDEFETDETDTPHVLEYDNSKPQKKKTVGSVSYLPSVMGLIIASEIINGLVRDV